MFIAEFEKIAAKKSKKPPQQDPDEPGVVTQKANKKPKQKGGKADAGSAKGYAILSHAMEILDGHYQKVDAQNKQRADLNQGQDAHSMNQVKEQKANREQNQVNMQQNAAAMAQQGQQPGGAQQPCAGGKPAAAGGKNPVSEGRKKPAKKKEAKSKGKDEGKEKGGGGSQVHVHIHSGKGKEK
jgi:hypothetical protein